MSKPRPKKDKPFSKKDILLELDNCEQALSALEALAPTHDPVALSQFSMRMARNRFLIDGCRRMVQHETMDAFHADMVMWMVTLTDGLVDLMTDRYTTKQ